MSSCSCQVPCICVANIIADSLQVSPLYHQQENERWAKASARYEELNELNGRERHFRDEHHHSLLPGKRSIRTKSRSECHSPSIEVRLTAFDAMRSAVEEMTASLPTLQESQSLIDTSAIYTREEEWTTSLPMSLHKVSSLNRSLATSVSSSRGDSGCSSLELEAVAAMHELSFAVESICVSEMLPRTGELIFVNVTTLEGQPYCLELTLKGWRVASLRSDCMIGDFTRLDLFTQYYDTLYALLDDISPGYRQRFGERLAKKLMMLQTEDHEGMAPSSSYCSPPLSLSSKGSTDSLPVVTPVPSPVPERERDDRIISDTPLFA